MLRRNHAYQGERIAAEGMPMAHLIIGHATEETARIWVQGDKWHRACRVVLQRVDSSAIPQDEPPFRDVRISSEADYTATVDFDSLRAGAAYTVRATFSPSPEQEIKGRLRTTAQPSGDKPLPFSFVLSSCNLSVISINDLLAFLLAAGGTSAADSSLDLPVERWNFPKFAWLWRIVRLPLRWALYGVAWVVQKTTGIKQPGPPLLRSPFLKLTAVFDWSVLEYTGDETSRPAVGDVISSAGGEAVLACSVKQIEDRDPQTNTPPTWRMVVTQVEGTFARDEVIFRRPPGAPGDQQKTVGTLTGARPGSPWYEQPSFFLHAGDQIYYDFPDERRAPKRDDYRIAYREAWFEDAANRHLLSHWPHYMTLDDHEIADQFARDFKPPAVNATPDTYLQDALGAYRDYVQSRNPSAPGGSETDGVVLEHFWYRFDKGLTRFFVLDTRTQRFDHADGSRDSQMIDDGQMAALLHWMTTYKDDLKFVITSVPFVAEINDSFDAAPAKWNARDKSAGQGSPSGQPLNPANDKWSAAQFKRQRDEIIDYIARYRIEHLVFLTGDMHCCYHATLRIGTGSKYESVTVHELAGGPANQLQLAEISEFHTLCSRHTDAGLPYEVVLDRFHSEANAVMHLKVEYVDRDGVLSSDPAFAPEVEWNVIRTLTDNGTSAWVSDGRPLFAAQGQKQVAPVAAISAKEPTMAGRISFVKKRAISDLRSWA
jgi:phosphodiesterase/alkaline phosphatase D-like protein